MTAPKSYAPRLHQMIAAGYELKSFPVVVEQLIRELDDPTKQSRDFAAIMEQDIALSERILKLVNSSLFGFRNRYVSISRAITALGHKTIKTLAFSHIGMNLFADMEVAPAQSDQLWSHSLASAITARLITETTGIASTDEAFLAGILHDLGKLVFLDVAQGEYADLLSSHGDELLDRECKLFGFRHDDVGFRLVSDWPIPDQVKHAVLFHHNPQSTATVLAEVISVADQLVHAYGIGGPASDREFKPETKGFQLNETDVELLAEKVSEIYSESVALFK